MSADPIDPTTIDPPEELADPPEERVTQEQMVEMVKEITLGMEPSLRTPAADRMRALLTEQIAAIKAAGGFVDIPFD